MNPGWLGAYYGGLLILMAFSAGLRLMKIETDGVAPDEPWWFLPAWIAVIVLWPLAPIAWAVWRFWPLHDWVCPACGATDFEDHETKCPRRDP